MNVAITLVKENQDELTVRYTEKDAGENSLLAAGLLLRRSALPDHPPSVLRATLRWEQDEIVSGTVATGAENAKRVAPAAADQWPIDVKAGDRLTVIKSRGAGVKSPPEWLEQYVGKTGVVLWTTVDGAMLDIDGNASWFSYKELKPGR